MRVRVEHRIGVQTPAREVWRHLSDLSSWAAWNPMYPEASGKLQIGGVLDLVEVMPGKPPRKIVPTVVDWVPDAQIIWTHRGAGGLTRIRYLEIEPLTETGCIFASGEIYQGFLARFISRKKKRALREAFAALCEAMKARAEGVTAPVVEAPAS